MIFAIKPFEIHDGDGIRTTVFFKGCPLRCRWCHNPESFTPKIELLYDAELCQNCLSCTKLCSANRFDSCGNHIFIREDCVKCGKCTEICPTDAFELAGKECTPEEVAEEVLRDELFLKGSGGGVTFSGGEPLMQAEFCASLAAILKERGLNIAVDTCAYASRKAIDLVAPYTDTFLIDIKAIDESTHIACTGVSNRTILDNITYIDSLGIPIELRYPYVPTMNDWEVESIGEFAASLKHVIRMRILPYHSYADKKYSCLGYTYPIPDVRVPTKAEIAAAVDVMRSCGVNVEQY